MLNKMMTVRAQHGTRIFVILFNQVTDKSMMKACVLCLYVGDLKRSPLTHILHCKDYPEFGRLNSIFFISCRVNG